jgi:molybdenum-dependent DNA-binding transcriptional regulator ModE
MQRRPPNPREEKMIDEIDGLEELLRACKKLEREVQERVKKAIEPIMEALNAEAKSQAQPFVDSGSLQKTFDFKIQNLGGGNRRIIWGIQGVQLTSFISDKGERKPYKYLHLVDGGTAQRKTEKGYNRGSVNPTHFYTKLMEKYDKLIKEAIEETLEEIESEIP